MRREVIALEQVDETMVAVVGGKGASLGALNRLAGVSVPPGFCVTTEAFAAGLAAVPAVDELLDGLSAADTDDRDALAHLADELRRAVETHPVADHVAAAITAAVAEHGKAAAWAVRSSATAEDLPAASFAGQHDSFLGVVGAGAVVEHVRRCWASLFTQRAVAYRRRRGLDDRSVRMAVVVQELVDAAASGVLFTADPISGDRRDTVVEAAAGLGDALVGGLVAADRFRARGNAILDRTVIGDAPVLDDEQVHRLVALGRRVEAALGRPQDLEWCVAADRVHVVQSRPITTLFPVPVRAPGDDRARVFLSVGHQQMMTDALRPLGLSIRQLAALRPMDVAGGRQFVDVTDALASPVARGGLLDAVGRGDPLTRDALEILLERGDVVPEPTATGAPPGPPPPPGGGPAAPIDADPALVADLVEEGRRSVEDLARILDATAGDDVFDVIEHDIDTLKVFLSEPRCTQAIMAGMEATWWLDEHLVTWLGDEGVGVGDIVTRSAPGNVTSEMGLALLDVADAVRAHPALVSFLEDLDPHDDGFLDRLDEVPGGIEARAAFEGFLERYGVRCVGEIDLTRPRWREQPSALVPLVLGDVRAHPPGEGARRFEAGRRQAEAKAAEVLARVRALPDGDAKAAETAAMIDRVRTFIGYREHPKFLIVSRYDRYKRALVAEASQLVAHGTLRTVDDAWYLTFEELRDAVRTGTADLDLVDRRRDEHRAHESLTPPRVLTSHGEGLDGDHRREDLPDGALAGLAVSTGVVEGRARVVHDLADAAVEPGDILVTAFTDPSWSPLFVAIAGLVTEVGGLMTHGAVVAREYGLPTVVGVARATERIVDGRRIRLDATRGHVELLE